MADRAVRLVENFAFAKTGNPSIDGEISYPIYNATSESYVELTDIAEAKSHLGERFSDD